MKSLRYKRSLLCSVASGMMGAIALLGFQGQAQANSICTADTSTTPHSFNCVDVTTDPNTVANGTFTAGAMHTPHEHGGLNLSSAAELDVTLNGEITAFSALGVAVNLTAAGPLTFVNNGTITGAWDWLYATRLTSNQSIVANTGNLSVDGTRVAGVIAESQNGDITITGGTTAVSGHSSRGMWVQAYAGDVVVNTGNVTATGELARGVLVGADAACDSGPGHSATVNVTGDVTAEYRGIVSLSCDVSTINVEAGRTVAASGVTGIAIVNVGLGATVTNIDGSVLAESIGNLALDIRDGSSTTAIGSSGLLFGTFDGEENVDAITIAAGGTWSSAGTSDFRGGTDALDNSGTINAESATFANLEAYTNNGTLSLTGGSFTLTGSSEFTNNGTIEAAPGETTITSDSALINNGALDLQNGEVGDILTIANDYVAGTSATLLIDVNETASDVMVINGSSSGSTQLFVDAPESVNSNGIMIANLEAPLGAMAVGNASQPAIKFVLGNQASRLIDFQLEQVGAGLYLTALPNPTAFQPLLVGHVGRDLWHQSTDIYSGYAALRRNDHNVTPRKSVRVWGQAYASRTEDGEQSTQTVFGSDVETDSRMRTNRKGVQAGVEMALGVAVAAGLTAGYGTADANFRSVDGGIDADGWNIGVYGQAGGATGVYGSVLVKYDSSDLDLTDSAFDLAEGRPDATSFGGQAEVGYRWNSGSTRLDLGSSLSYVKTSIDDFAAEGIDFDYDSTDSLRGSLDARVVFAGGRMEPFVNARLLHEFEGDSRMSMVSGSEADQVETDGNKTWVRLEAGIAGKKGSGPNLSGWAELGDVEGFGVQGGWRF